MRVNYLSRLLVRLPFIIYAFTQSHRSSLSFPSESLYYIGVSDPLDYYIKPMSTSTPSGNCNAPHTRPDEETPLREMVLQPSKYRRVGLFPSCPEFSSGVQSENGLSMPKVRIVFSVVDLFTHISCNSWRVIRCEITLKRGH